MATLESPETPECRVFREHYNRLVQSIQDPLPLATLLFSEDAIIAVVKEMSVLGLSTLEKNDVLLSAVEKQIQLDPETFHVFVSALNEDPSMQLLVESMQSKSFMCGSIYGLYYLWWKFKLPYSGELSKEKTSAIKLVKNVRGENFGE